ncbi:AAA family ATPase [Streptomyces canus]|uniref:AAA family ATPase n=1 Tax=Streptomyces canus TaxID=58343 RepID=UPI003245A595
MAAWSDTKELIRWGTAARLDRTDDGPLGRDGELKQVHDYLSDPDGPRLVLVHGELGVGRTAFLKTVGEQLRARGTALHTVDCVPGDGERPLLLALRLVMALEEHRSAPRRQRSAGKKPVTEALGAVDRRDRTAMETSLRASLTQAGPLAVLVDDVQLADPDSLAVLCRMDFSGFAPGVRLVVSAKDAREPGRDGSAGLLNRLAGVEGARTVALSPLGHDDVTALAALWLQAIPDAALARQTGELTCGVPGAVDALLTGWTRRGEIRVADGHAFIGARTPVPVLPEDDRFVTALDALGEPYRAVAAALSILGPLGPPALQLTATWTGLSADAVNDSVRGLVEAGIVNELPAPAPDSTTAQGWTFRLPLTEHTIREGLRPMERSRLSALATEAVWTGADSRRAGERIPPTSVPLDEATAVAYRADRVADAGSLVDRERAVAELTDAARRIPPGTDDQAVLRWLRAAHNLTEHADARDLALQRYILAAYWACDHRTGRADGESLLRNPGPTLTELDLQEAACLVVAVTANERDWQAMSRLATASWWDALPVPDLAKVTGRALALLYLSRWREAAELLQHNETVWDTGPRARAAPARFKAHADLARGRPESYWHEATMYDAPELPPGKVYALVGGMFDTLFTGYDLNAANALLETADLTVQMLPPVGRFLFDHATGRWDQALESARRMLANNEVQSAPVFDSSLLPARTAAILLARGRLTTALQMVEDMRGPGDSPPQCALNASEAELLMTLGDLDGAEKTLRSALATAQEHDQMYGTDELWALLAEVTVRAGRTGEATACLDHLERIAARTGTDRSHLLRLLASARVLRTDAPDTARDNLREAGHLARTRGLPFETATTLLAAATTGPGPATLLYEAYDLFGTTGATLWRHHTRTAMRAAQLAGPGRKQTTTENEHLLATLITEGLTNRQIATVLRLNEDAVAQRLTRLLARTGKRSRAEVVTSVLTGSL